MTTTATKSRPILFSGPMVRAILDGRKTQTRRVVKAPRWWEGHTIPAACYHESGEKAGYQRVLCSRDGDKQLFCPYGQPGDELWVRETWRPLSAFDPSPETGAQYWADSHAGLEKRNGDAKWRPSIHMPRWASRITLTVKAIRVERLQDISEADAMAEGCGSYTPAYVSGGEIVGADGILPSDEFRDLWQSINGPDSWAANPWVWVVEFQRKETN